MARTNFILEQKEDWLTYSCELQAVEKQMPGRRKLLVIAAAAAAATFVPIEASARSRVMGTSWAVSPDRGLAAADFCGGRLPAYGTDACGYRELRYGPGSCWRRLPYHPASPEPRRVWICG